MKLPLLMLGLLLSATPDIHAQAPGCALVPSSTAVAETLRWNGPCKDGWADGKGILDNLDDATGWRYQGELRRGQAHGQGYLKMNNGHEFEGDYVDGKLEGLGIMLTPFGDRYDGSFKNGKRDGRGSMSYSLGGRYDGDWKDDLFHGQGIAQYPGGRKLEITFANGAPAGQAVPERSSELYDLNAADAATGSNLRRAVASGSDVPLNRSYEQMTVPQRNNVRARYRLMDEGDEPPYPLYGMAKLHRVLFDVNRRTSSAGPLRLVIVVGIDGKPISANIHAAPDPAMGKFAANVFMLETFKPALCGGRPCEMAFPVNMEFARRP